MYELFSACHFRMVVWFTRTRFKFSVCAVFSEQNTIAKWQHRNLSFIWNFEFLRFEFLIINFERNEIVRYKQKKTVRMILNNLSQCDKPIFLHFEMTYNKHFLLYLDFFFSNEKKDTILFYWEQYGQTHYNKMQFSFHWKINSQTFLHKYLLIPKIQLQTSKMCNYTTLSILNGWCVGHLLSYKGLVTAQML